MKILFTIAHYFNSEGSGKHGSLSKDPLTRIVALSNCLTNLRSTFSQSQCLMDISQWTAFPLNDLQTHKIDIVICTTQNHHLLEHLEVPDSFYHHYSTNAEPMMLGFECQAVLRDRLGEYDYYCYLEDDLIIHDPWFFIKLNWFTKQTEDLNILLPNRYEIGALNTVCKAYIDGNISSQTTADFQDLKKQPELKEFIMKQPVLFRGSLNPHSGCYFLNASQMAYWSQQSYFLDRDCRFISPLESAATLGIMKTFRIYKPAEPLSFLEIQHSGNAFLTKIGNTMPLDSPLLKIKKILGRHPRG